MSPLLLHQHQGPDPGYRRPFRCQAACRLHHDGAEHVAFSERVKAAGLAPDNLFFRTYQSTGNGFLLRN